MKRSALRKSTFFRAKAKYAASQTKKPQHQEVRGFFGNMDEKTT
jgi:hypothetical protein